MKKRYINPQLTVVNITIRNMFMQMSISSKELDSNVGLSHKDSGWDIWGNDEEE